MSSSNTDPNGKYIFYHYDPSLVAAVIFIALFSILTSVHVFQMAWKRTWYFIPFVIGGIFETVGYVGRAISSQQSPNWTTMPYVLQSLFLLIAPAFFAASIYMVLGRIIRITDGEAHSVIRARWLTKLFVLGDVLSFFAQSTGGGMQASAKNQNGFKLGEKIIVVGLFIQVFFFGSFIIVAGLFNFRLARCPTNRSVAVPWTRYLGTLYVASILIMIRSLFRIVEYLQGQSGTLLGHEIYLYIFDSTLMSLTMVIFNFWHPGWTINMHLKKQEDSESACSAFPMQVSQLGPKNNVRDNNSNGNGV